MKIRRILCALLSSVMVLGMVLSAVPATAAGNPGYYIEGEVSGGVFTVHVYVQNAVAYSGKLALSYDTDLLELETGNTFFETVKQSSNASVTPEQNDPSVLLGDGHVMFAWISKSNGTINAQSTRKEIASVRFRLLNGVSENDFNVNTLSLYYVNATMIYGWSCSAAVVTKDLSAYRNNAVNPDYLCDISFDYPNCDYVPPTVYKASVNVADTSGKPVTAAVTVDNAQSYTDMGGHTDFKLLDGVYSYRISASGYETKSGYFIIDGKDEVFTVQLRSNTELAQYVADNLKIGYVDGDSAQSVTANITLPVDSEYGSITWTSSYSGVLSTSGIINRKYDDTVVTLTAYVKVGSATVTKDFDLTVKSRYTAEEKNAMMVANDKAALNIVYAPGDSAQSVTVRLELPEKGDYGSTISWESSNAEVIDASGNVTRPESSTVVTLTAYIIRGTAVDTKEFAVVVKGQAKATPVPTKEPVSTAAPTPLPAQTETPAVTEAPNATDSPAETPAPNPTDTPKPTDTPNATAAPTDAPVLPEYEELTDGELVANVINALEIGYAKDENADNVKSNLTLPFVGAENTVIGWESSAPSVITPYGGVVRQAEDILVTLTATVTHGDASEVKTFTVTVKAADEIPINPNNGQEEEIAVRNSRRRRIAVTEQSDGRSETGEASGKTEEREQKTEEKTQTEQEKKETKKFVDIDTVPWARNAINTLTARGVINGTSDTTYSPQDNIRRADFVMLLMKLYDLDSDITQTFEDVAESKYYYEAVSKAKSLGIIAGIDDTHFNPDGYISRQDMMTMTYRALLKLGKAEMETDTLSGFTDANEVSDYALESVEHLVGGGYINGDDNGRLNPKAYTTRAETAVFLYNLDN